MLVPCMGIMGGLTASATGAGVISYRGGCGKTRDEWRLGEMFGVS